MKFGIVKGTVRVLANIILSVLDFVLGIVYLLLPVGLYMLMLQSRERVSKASAISTFTEDNSTFQLIHHNFILVCINPNLIKTNKKNFMKSVDKFFEKYKSVIILGSILMLLIAVYVGMLIK